MLRVPKQTRLFSSILTITRNYTKPSREDIKKYDEEVKQRFPELKSAEAKINAILDTNNQHLFREVAIETIKTPPFVFFVLIIILVFQSLFKRRSAKKLKEEIHIKTVQKSSYEQQVLNLNEQIATFQKE